MQKRSTAWDMHRKSEAWPLRCTAGARPEGCQGRSRIRAVLALHSLYKKSVTLMSKSGWSVLSDMHA